MAQERTVRDALLDHSDTQACRRVWEAEQAGEAAEPRALVETVRVSDGELAIEGWDGAARIYVRWNPEAGVYERLTCWPPTTLVGFARENRDGVLRLLEEVRGLRPVLTAESPLGSERTATLLAEWPR